MAEDADNKEDQFDFTADGEALGYISIAQARLLAMQTARETPGDYGRGFTGTLMAFEVVESSEDEDYYIVTLGIRPQGAFSGKPGQEQFFISKEGIVSHRQVLDVPSGVGNSRMPLVIAGIAAVVILAVIIGVSIGGNGEDDAPVDIVVDPDPPVTIPAIVVQPTDTPAPPTPKPATTAPQFPTAPPSPTARELGYTVTPPPLPSVHVASVDIDYDMLDGSTDVVYLIEVLDSLENPVADAGVTLAILEATGKEFKIEGETDEQGDAFLEYSTTSLGIHSTIVVNITGPVTWADAVEDRTTYEKFIPVFKNVETENGAIRARIPIDWAWSTES